MPQGCNVKVGAWATAKATAKATTNINEEAKCLLKSTGMGKGSDRSKGDCGGVGVKQNTKVNV